MTRADDCSHLVRRLNVAGTHDEQLIGDFMLIYHESGAPVHIHHSSECVLNAGETLLVQGENEDDKVVCLSATQAALIVVHINRTRRTP
jgi:environmental stress-induced protein Ves